MTCMQKLCSWRSLLAAKHVTPCWIPMKLEVGVASCGLVIYLQGAALFCVTHDLVLLSRKTTMNNPMLFSPILHELLFEISCTVPVVFSFPLWKRFPPIQASECQPGDFCDVDINRDDFINYFLWEVINTISKIKIYIHPSVDVQCIPLWTKVLAYWVSILLIR